MADEAPAAQSGGNAHLTPGDHDATHQIIPPMHNTSRKSTLTKSAFDFQVASGTETPMTFGTHNRNRDSRIMPDLDEYFVCPVPKGNG